MVHTRLPQSPMTSRHFPQHDSEACIPAQKESVSSICSLEATACFELVSAAHHLPAMRFSSEVQRDGNPWAPFCHQTYDCLWHYDWEVMNQPPDSPDLTPSGLHLFEPQKKHLAGKWFARDTNMKKLSHPAANSSHSFLLCWVTSFGTRMGQKFKYQWCFYVGVWYVPSATRVSCIMDGRINFSASVFGMQFYKPCCCIYQWQ